jgi:cytochrome c oxidase assembly protein subunit 15
LGGITVLTKLNPLSVASHFVLSTILIAAAHTLVMRSRVPRNQVHKKSKLIQLHTSLTFIVIVAGTLVTGAGPHAGDVTAPRLDIAIPVVAAIHGFLVIALIALTLVGIYRPSTREAQRYLIIFLAIALAQGTIGYVQYLLGVPETLVAAHLLGSSILWISAWRIRLTQYYALEN